MGHTKSLRYEHLEPFLVEAVREQQKEIEAYKNEIDEKSKGILELEERFGSLEKKTGLIFCIEAEYVPEVFVKQA